MSTILFFIINLSENKTKQLCTGIWGCSLAHRKFFDCLWCFTFLSLHYGNSGLLAHLKAKQTIPLCTAVSIHLEQFCQWMHSFFTHFPQFFAHTYFTNEVHLDHCIYYFNLLSYLHSPKLSILVFPMTCHLLEYYKIYCLNWGQQTVSQ